MDFEGLQILLKAPKKKYIKKLLQFAIALSHTQHSAPQSMSTPISDSFPHDMQLTAQESHRLMNSLISLVKIGEDVDYDQDRLKQLLQGHLQQQLSSILVDLLSKLRQDIHAHSVAVVSQADKLLGFNWKLDMEVATDKGKVNTPVVQLQLNCAQGCRMDDVKVLMKGTQFSVFFKNLQKIKEQLEQLISTSHQ